VTRPRSTFPFLALIAVSALLSAARVDAQVCGDADASGTVTVTDGVQALRAAAGLSTVCTTALCDVDGSGSITVTDGVNVLRKAAGLSAPDACPGGASGDGVQVAVDSVVPFLAFGLQFVSDVGLASSAIAPAGTGEGTDDCPDGGTRTKSFLGNSGQIIRIGFNACRYSAPGLGSFQFDKGLIVNFFRFQVSLSVDVTDLASGRLVHFEKFFNFEPRDGGGFIASGVPDDGTGAGGPILITTPQGNFLLTLNDLNIDGDGHAVSGGGSIAEETKPGNFALDKIDFQVTNPITTATLAATFDDGHTNNFVVNLLTGDVTPA
jgi:hypothetical protein